MPVNISQLKQIIEQCPDDGNVYVYIREYEEYELYYVERISTYPFSLEFEVRKDISNTIQVSEIKNVIENYDDESSIEFSVIDPRFVIMRGGDFSNVRTDENRNLLFYTFLTP